MFDNTISVRYETVAKDHVRMSFNPGTFVYNDVTDSVTQTVRISQNTTKARFRRELRISRDKITENPLTNVNQQAGASVYIVIDEPRFGFSDSELNDMVISLTHFLGGAAATNSATAEKVIAGES